MVETKKKYRSVRSALCKEQKKLGHVWLHFVKMPPERAEAAKVPGGGNQLTYKGISYWPCLLQIGVRVELGKGYCIISLQWHS